MRVPNPPTDFIGWESTGTEYGNSAGMWPRSSNLSAAAALVVPGIDACSIAKAACGTHRVSYRRYGGPRTSFGL